jgi:hypothetical protein
MGKSTTKTAIGWSRQAPDAMSDVAIVASIITRITDQQSDYY